MRMTGRFRGSSARRGLLRGSVGALAVGLVLGSCVKGGETGPVVGRGEDRLPNVTASDWVTYADHVVAVTIRSERALPVGDKARRRGEGSIRREIALAVDEVLWSHPSPAQPAPSGSFEWSVTGWVFEGDKRRSFAVSDTPRLEPGHSYVLAIAWEPEVEDGGEIFPAHWEGLGENAVLPFDDGVIGKGESEGKVYDDPAAAARAEESGVTTTIEEELNGKGAADLVEMLSTARPTEKKDFGRPG